MKTSELTGAALDWAVAKCEGVLEAIHETTSEELWYYDREVGSDKHFWPSTDWAQGGPIIEREEISVNWANGQWQAHTVNKQDEYEQIEYGPTPLIAAMRCYVASKLGDEVDVPAELTACS
jgi:hypothetical protein